MASPAVAPHAAELRRESTSPSAPQAAVFYALLTAVLTWPQVLHLGSIPEGTDGFFSLWRLSWFAHQLPLDPRHLFDGNIFYPARDVLAFSDAVLLQSAIAAPFIWQGVPVVIVYNLLVLASFLLCGLGTFLLVRELTGRAGAALVAGIVFAFATTRFDHYFHLELLWAQWMPLALWAVHRAIASGRLRDGVLCGACLAALGLSCIYYAVFLATLLVVFVPVLLVAAAPGRRLAAVRALALAALIAIVTLTPYMLQYRQARAEVGERQAGYAVLYAAGPRHYMAAMPTSVVYGKLLGAIGTHERRLFPGFVALALLVVALWPPWTRTRLTYLLALAVALDISAGHRGVLYAWLREHVVLYRGLRVPARAGHLVLLVVAVLAGFGAARVSGWLERSKPARRAAVMALLGAAIVAECLVWPLTLVAVPMSPGEVYRWLNTQPAGGAVVELPMRPSTPGPYWGRSDAEFEYLSTFHWRPLLNGYSGNEPAGYKQLLVAMDGFPSDASVDMLRANDVRYVILHERMYGAAAYARVVDALDRRTDVKRCGSFREGESAAAAYCLTRPVLPLPPRVP